MLFSGKQIIDAKKLLLKLSYNSPKFQYFLNGGDFYSCEAELDELGPDLEYQLSQGASRFVIIPDDGTYVIKCDIEGEDDNTDFFCKKEAQNYVYACEEGLEKYFAKMGFLCSMGERNFYIQERVECDEEQISDSLISLHELENDPDLFYDLDTVDRMRPLWESNYGVSNANRLEGFCFEHEINDIHEGNVGYNDDYYPVIVDYCGF